MSWLLLVVAAAILKLLVAELFDWCPWLAERMICRAVGKLPKAVRERYENEWLGELDALPGRRVSMLGFALWTWMGSPRTCRELARGSTMDGVSVRGLAIKHASDRVMALVLLISLAPALVVAALAVRLSSGGPVFVRQRRIGLKGKPFDLYKFRLIRAVDGSAGTLNNSGATSIFRDVGRLTTVGRFLRRTSFEELPQLFNVLRGELSLIGPRPAHPELAELFGREIAGYNSRYRVKAGMTGWAQVHSLRGQTSMTDLVAWDNYYVAHWSLRLDLKIMALTVVALFRTVE